MLCPPIIRDRLDCDQNGLLHRSCCLLPIVWVCEILDATRITSTTCMSITGVFLLPFSLSSSFFPSLFFVFILTFCQPSSVRMPQLRLLQCTTALTARHPHLRRLQYSPRMRSTRSGYSTRLTSCPSHPRPSASSHRLTPHLGAPGRQPHRSPHVPARHRYASVVASCIQLKNGDVFESQCDDTPARMQSTDARRRCAEQLCILRA